MQETPYFVENPARAAKFFAAAVGAFALCVLIAVYLPRALSFLPGVAGLLLWAAWPYGAGGRRPSCRFALMGAGVTVVLAAVSAVWAIDSGEAIERAGKAAAVLLPGSLAVAVALAMPRAHLARLWWVVPAAVGAAAVLLNIEYVLNMPVFRALRGIDAAAHVERYELNRASVAVVLLAVPCIGMVYGHLRRAGSSLLRAWVRTGIYAALFVPAVSETESQTAQMAFAAGFLMLALFPANLRRAWQGLAVLLCAGIMAAPFLAQYLFGMVPAPGAVPEDGIWAWLSHANVFERLEIWDYVSRYAMQRPVTGFGIEATRMVEAFDNKELYQPGLTVLHPHNGAIQIWIEFGAIGAALACAGAWMVLGRVSALKPQLGRRMAGAAFAGAVMVALTGYGLWQGWWLGLLMLLAAVTVAGVRSLRPDEAENAPVSVG